VSKLRLSDGVPDRQSIFIPGIEPFFLAEDLPHLKLSSIAQLLIPGL
jgi:hypothetical protein